MHPFKHQLDQVASTAVAAVVWIRVKYGKINRYYRPTPFAQAEHSSLTAAGYLWAAMHHSISLIPQLAMDSKAFATYLVRQRMRQRMEAIGASQEISYLPLVGTLAHRSWQMALSLSLRGASMGWILQFLLITILRMRY